MEINGTIAPLILMDKDENGDSGTYVCSLDNTTVSFDISNTGKLIISLSLLIIILIGSFGNPIMIVCICRTWSSNHVMCRHILHLTIGDLIRVFFCLPIRFAIYYDRIPYNDENMMLFQTKIFMDIFTEILQLQILLLISKDRYYAVAKPFEKHHDRNIKSICILVCSWSCAFFGASCAAYFYEDYLRLLSTCEAEMQLFAFVILFLIYESLIISGIIQFYLRTIYFLLKQGKKMRSMRHSIHPFVPHSEVKERTDSIRNEVRFKFITKEKNKMVDDAAVSKISAVPDFKCPEEKIVQNEVQSEIKIDSNVSKGLPDSTCVIPTSADFLLPNVSEDINERMTRLQLQKVTPENFVTDPNYREKKDVQSDIPAEATEFLEHSQKDDKTKRLDIVINCTFNSIATKTKIVDSQNSSIKGQLPSVRQANKIVDTKEKTAANLETVDGSTETEKSRDGLQMSSRNDGSEIPAKKIFVISQQVAFTVRSVQTLSVGLKEDANMQSSCSGSKDESESSIQHEKVFDNKEECPTKDSRQNVKIEIPGQIKIDEETEKKMPTFQETIDGTEMDTSIKLADKNLTLTTSSNTETEMDTSIKLADKNLTLTTSSNTETTSNKENIINVAGPFCPMPKRSKMKQRFHKEVRITQRIMVLIIFLILCWIPLYAFRFQHILILHSKLCCPYPQYPFVWWETLSASTSAINPCLYGILNIQLRREFFRLLRHFRNFVTNCRCCR